MSTFISTMAILLALSGFGAMTTMSSSASSNSPTTLDSTGINGAPVCTNTLPNCGLD